MGVAHCGMPGKQDNCQLPVMLSVATMRRAYPSLTGLSSEAWADDEARRTKQGCPHDVQDQAIDRTQSIHAARRRRCCARRCPYGQG